MAAQKQMSDFFKYPSNAKKLDGLKNNGHDGISRQQHSKHNSANPGTIQQVASWEHRQHPSVPIVVS